MPIGHAREPGSFSAGNAHTDLAFWGDLVFQGSYDGFRVVDISDPMAPRVMADVNCQGGQGDVAVWEGLLFRAVDRPQTGRGCDSVDTPGSTPGFEGIQIFDISDPAAPRRIRSVPVDCGAHTITLVPKPRLDRVILYVSSSFPGFFGRRRSATSAAPTTAASPSCLFRWLPRPRPTSSAPSPSRVTIATTSRCTWASIAPPAPAGPG